MAKAMAEKFADESARYRRRPHLETFASSDSRYIAVFVSLLFEMNLSRSAAGIMRYP